MKRINRDRLTFLSILMLFSTVTMVDAVSLPGFSGLMPFCTGAGILVIAAILIGTGVSSGFSRVFGGYFGLKIHPGDPVQRDGQGQEEILPWIRVLACWGWMLGFFVLILLAGYFIAIPLFTFLFLWRFCGKRWLSSAAATLIIWGFVYFISSILRMGLFSGIFFGEILPLL